MDLTQLTATGLSRSQAEAYALLIELGQVKPPEAAKHLNITRTNAYKLLDKLVELKLAFKTEQGKVLSYSAANPLALANMAAKYRAEAVAREEATSKVIHELLAHYQAHNNSLEVTVANGQKEVADAYRTQLGFREDIYFIHTKADVPMMGFDTMHDLRVTPGRHGKKRYGILPVSPDTSTVNKAPHERSQLQVTWASDRDYNAPVEWSVTESTLLIVLYDSEPRALLIADKVVAGAFMQIWHLVNSLLEQRPLHQKFTA